jgi:hypothetical protein
MWWHMRRHQISSFGETDESLKSPGASVRSTTGSWGVRISGSNAGYTMFRSSVKSAGYPLHSPVSPSLPLPCVTVCHNFSTGLYQGRPRNCTGFTVLGKYVITWSKINYTLNTYSPKLTEDGLHLSYANYRPGFGCEQTEILSRYIVNPLTPNDIYIYMSYRTANLQTLHFIHLVNNVLNILNMLHSLCFFLFKMPFVS